MPLPSPTNNLVSPLLTDLYQITMAYSYFANQKQDQIAVFDLFFRKNPFGGEYVVFAGLEECLRHIQNFKFCDTEVDYLRTVLPKADPAFFDYLLQLSSAHVKVFSIPEGSLVFPREPLLRLEGPIGVLQLLETSLLNLINFPSLVATNASVHRTAAGKNKKLLEFGLRRAQGPDGGVSASRYSFLGGFDGTSNVLAGHLFGIPISGTHAHSYISSFTNEDTFTDPSIIDGEGKKIEDFWAIVQKTRQELGGSFLATNTGELIAFTAYARSFPEKTLVLVDTYDTECSGLLNFIVLAKALHTIGHKAIGIRLDSGDLAYLSNQARKLFVKYADVFGLEYFKAFTIVASNDINVRTLESLNQQGHSIDTYGIGTHLVTCQAQPALGCVYKLVEIDNQPRIKLSQEITKVTIPGKKAIYRLWGKSEFPIVDLLCTAGEDEPQAGSKILCRHPFAEHKRVLVNVTKVQKLLSLYLDNGVLVQPLPTLQESRDRAIHELSSFRADHLRIVNPTPYKVSVSAILYEKLHELWLANSPILEL